MLDKDTRSVILSYFDIDDLTQYYWYEPKRLAKAIKFYYGNWPTIEQLIEAGKIISVKYFVKMGIETPYKFLELSVISGNLNLVKFFISIGMHPKERHLQVAVESGHLSIIKHFRTVGLFLNPTLMDLAKQKSYEDIIKYYEDKY